MKTYTIKFAGSKFWEGYTDMKEVLQDVEGLLSEAQGEVTLSIKMKEE